MGTTIHASTTTRMTLASEELATSNARRTSHGFGEEVNAVRSIDPDGILPPLEPALLAVRQQANPKLSSEDLLTVARHAGRKNKVALDALIAALYRSTAIPAAIRGRLLSSEEEVEEVKQETLLIVSMKISMFEGVNLGGWVIAIAKNQAGEVIGKQNRDVGIKERIQAQGPPRRSSVSSGIANRLLRAELIRDLPSAQKRSAGWKWMGYNDEEAAHEEGKIKQAKVSPQAIRIRRHRFRKEARRRQGWLDPDMPTGRRDRGDQ